jgi:hypothetical protein
MSPVQKGRLDSALVKSALAHGKKQAERARAVARAAAAGPYNGLLVAEGDSWFDYPFYDVLEKLKSRFNYHVKSAAHRGDTVEDMAFADEQTRGLSELFLEVKANGETPKAILLSGGGNDIAGDEFGMLLNHRNSGLDPFSEKVLQGVLDERVVHAIVSVIGFMTYLSNKHFGKSIPILVHGYGRPVPDGRGFWGGAWILPGPWLRPGFEQKGYRDLAECTALVGGLIDRFNGLLSALPAEPGLEHVRYVDLRGALSNDLSGDAYEDSWGNELHPTENGFQAVASVFHAAIGALP